MDTVSRTARLFTVVLIVFTAQWDAVMITKVDISMGLLFQVKVMLRSLKTRLRLFFMGPTPEEYVEAIREMNWLIWKGDKALQALSQGDVEMASKFLQMQESHVK